MPRVGSKHSMVCTPPATQRAIVTFCWLPPDRRRTSPAARESIWSLRHRGVDLRRLSPEVDRAPAPEPGRRRQRDVLADRALHQQRLGAVGGHVHDTGQDRVGGVAEGHRRAIHEQLSAARTGGAGEDVEQLVLALALERGDAQDLARIEVERDVLEPRPVGEAAHGQAGLGAGRLQLGRRALRDRRWLVDDPPEHQLDDPVLRALGHIDHADRLALAQHGRAVADGGDLDHPVGDEDDRTGRRPSGGRRPTGPVR